MTGFGRRLPFAFQVARGPLGVICGHNKVAPRKSSAIGAKAVIGGLLSETDAIFRRQFNFLPFSNVVSNARFAAGGRHLNV
jgi:hypothetical protein